MRALIDALKRLTGLAPPEDRELARRITEFRRAVEAAEADRAALEALRAGIADRQLPEEEIELELEMLQAGLDVLDLGDRIAADGLPFVESQHKALAGEVCHFSTPVFLASDGNERTGRLLLSARRLLFLGQPAISVGWSGVLRIDDEHRDVVVHAIGRGLSYRFRCNSYSDARCAAHIARALKQGTRRPAG